MSSVGQVVNQNAILSRTSYENKVDMHGVNAKDVRVTGQSQDNVVNLATSQNQGSEQSKQDQHFSHQHHIAFNAYRFLSGQNEAKPQVQDVTVQAVITPGTEMKQDSAKTGNSEDTTTADNVGKTDKKSERGTEKPRSANGRELTDKEIEEIEELKKRDTEVRVHERAHQSAGGQYASAPSYDYVTGPDGKRYADGGHVNIDVGEESKPEATIAKMQIVKRAALAPQEPSGQDRRVYAQASQKEAKARQELAEQQKEESAAAVASQDKSADKSANVDKSSNNQPNSSQSNEGSSRSKSNAANVADATKGSQVPNEPPKAPKSTGGASQVSPLSE